jgi:hypothetical protein
MFPSGASARVFCMQSSPTASLNAYGAYETKVQRLTAAAANAAALTELALRTLVIENAAAFSALLQAQRSQVPGVGWHKEPWGPALRAAQQTTHAHFQALLAAILSAPADAAVAAYARYLLLHYPLDPPHDPSTPPAAIPSGLPA